MCNFFLPFVCPRGKLKSIADILFDSSVNDSLSSEVVLEDQVDRYVSGQVSKYVFNNTPCTQPPSCSFDQ